MQVSCRGRNLFHYICIEFACLGLCVSATLFSLHKLYLFIHEDTAAGTHFSMAPIVSVHVFLFL